MQLKLWVGIAALVLPSASAIATEDVTSYADSATERSVAGSGGWTARGESKRSSQKWNLDVDRSRDGSLRGTISVADSPLFARGRIEGHVAGSSVAGLITDDDGNHVARFSGTVIGESMKGTYTDRTGEVGDWNWDGGATRLIGP